MTIGRVCMRDVFLADKSENLAAAARRMATENVGTLLILDNYRRPVGILTDRDIALRAMTLDKDPRSLMVQDVMTADPQVIDESAPLEDALALMRAIPARRLPVINKNGELIGLISMDDILELLAEEMGRIATVITRETIPHMTFRSPPRAPAA